MGLISKQILEKINSAVRSATMTNQWKNCHSVIEWFKNLKDKHTLSFLMFDIVDFYPSISEKLLNGALDHASQFAKIQHRQVHHSVR